MDETISWRLGALAASLIPGFVLGLLLLRAGRRRLSPALLLIALVSGVLIALLPLAISRIEPAARDALSPTAFFLLRAFGLAGLSEEGAKLIACAFIVLPDARRRGLGDLILASGGVGLGFAMIENISYVLQASENWRETAIARALSSVPMHAFTGLLLGYGLALAQGRPAVSRVKVVGGFWLLCAALHGLYDLPLFLAEILPLSIQPANDLAGFFGVALTTLLAATHFVAVALTSAAALLALAAVSRDAGAGPTSPLRPRFLDAMLFSHWAGYGVGGLLLLAAAATILVSGVAQLAGAAPDGPIGLDAMAISVAAIGWGFGAEEFLTRPPLFAGRPRLSRAMAAAGLCAFAAIVWLGLPGARYFVASILVSSGMEHSKYGGHEKALVDFDAALRFSPDHVTALLATALVYRERLDYERALVPLDRAVASHPDNAVAITLRALVYAAQHDYARALPELNRALTLDPENLNLLTARGDARIDNGDLAGATADVERALRIKADSPVAHELRARLYAENDDLFRAMEEYGAALRIDPKSAGAWFARGRIAFEQQEFNAAANDLQRAVALAPTQRAYVALWLFLSRARQKLDGRQELANWTGVIARDVWPFPLIELYLGAKPVAAALAAATTDDQKCEFNFYVGELALAADFEPQARDMLRRASESCPAGFVETRPARREFARLQEKAKAAPPAPMLRNMSPPGSMEPSAGAGAPKPIEAAPAAPKSAPPRKSRARKGAEAPLRSFAARE